MKKTGILNAAISQVVATMGHNDKLVIADAGLPIPSGVQRIDLALTANVPRFAEALKVVLTELQVQEAIVAEEARARSPHIYELIATQLGDVPIKEVPHEQLKELTRSAVAVIRTGEFTPYANVILISGVVF
jgi:D-ribose pyranase